MSGNSVNLRVIRFAIYLKGRKGNLSKVVAQPEFLAPKSSADAPEGWMEADFEAIPIYVCIQQKAPKCPRWALAHKCSKPADETRLKNTSGPEGGIPKYL